MARPVATAFRGLGAFVLSACGCVGETRRGVAAGAARRPEQAGFEPDSSQFPSTPPSIPVDSSRSPPIQAKRSFTVSHVPRTKTVELNQRASHGDAAAALALLEQSMARGHQRIGLLRYLRARCLGATLEGRHHDYARRVTGKLSEAALASLAQEAQRRHQG